MEPSSKDMAKVILSLIVLTTLSFSCFLYVVKCNQGLVKEAINNNYAIYHPQTGKFTWLEK